LSALLTLILLAYVTSADQDQMAPDLNNIKWVCPDSKMDKPIPKKVL
jgi:hypothetical protein